MAEDVRFKRGKKEVITGDSAVAVLDGCIYFTTDDNNETTEMFVDMNGVRKQVVCGNGGGGGSNIFEDNIIVGDVEKDEGIEITKDTIRHLLGNVINLNDGGGILISSYGSIYISTGLSEISFGNSELKSIGEPTKNDSAATKLYVDNLIAGIGGGTGTLPDYYTSLIVKDGEEASEQLIISPNKICYTNEAGSTFMDFTDYGITVTGLFDINYNNNEPGPNTVATIQYVNDLAIVTKQSFEDSASIILEDNTEYYSSTSISTLTITYPSEDFISSIIFTLAEEGDITITLPDATKYIGGTPNFQNGQTWELNIKNGVLVGGLVE